MPSLVLATAETRRRRAVAESIKLTRSTLQQISDLPEGALRQPERRWQFGPKQLGLFEETKLRGERVDTSKALVECVHEVAPENPAVAHGWEVRRATTGRNFAGSMVDRITVAAYVAKSVVEHSKPDWMTRFEIDRSGERTWAWRTEVGGMWRQRENAIRDVFGLDLRSDDILSAKRVEPQAGTGLYELQHTRKEALLFQQSFAVEHTSGGEVQLLPETQRPKITIDTIQERHYEDLDRLNHIEIRPANQWPPKKVRQMLQGPESDGRRKEGRVALLRDGRPAGFSLSFRDNTQIYIGVILALGPDVFRALIDADLKGKSASQTAKINLLDHPTYEQYREVVECDYQGRSLDSHDVDWSGKHPERTYEISPREEFATID